MWVKFEKYYRIVGNVFQKHYTFPCGRWLAADEGDKEIVREMPAHGDDVKKQQPCTYIC